MNFDTRWEVIRSLRNSSHFQQFENMARLEGAPQKRNCLYIRIHVKIIWRVRKHFEKNKDTGNWLSMNKAVPRVAQDFDLEDYSLNSFQSEDYLEDKNLILERFRIIIVDIQFLDIIAVRYVLCSKKLDNLRFK